MTSDQPLSTASEYWLPAKPVPLSLRFAARGALSSTAAASKRVTCTPSARVTGISRSRNRCHCAGLGRDMHGLSFGAGAIIAGWRRASALLGSRARGAHLPGEHAADERMTLLDRPRLRPAVVTVGDEILYAERGNDNQSWLLRRLWELGAPATLALCVGDDADDIAATVRALKAMSLFPILVSGGIGGTHDDLTRQGVAAGLDLALVVHGECDRILRDHYGADYTAQRRRMAELPAGCALIDNPLGAPGFHVQGVYGFPGFPSMLQPMAEGVLAGLLPGNEDERRQVREYTLRAMEGEIAMPLERFAHQHPEIEIGIYPSTRRPRREVKLRLRYPDSARAVAREFDALIARLREALAGDANTPKG